MLSKNKILLSDTRNIYIYNSIIAYIINIDTLGQSVRNKILPKFRFRFFEFRCIMEHEIRTLDI